MLTLRRLLIFLFVFLLASLLVSCNLAGSGENIDPKLTDTQSITEKVTDQPPTSPAPTATHTPAATAIAPDYHWWNETVFAEIFVRSYLDTDGDGNGDFAGLLESLDYLNDGDPDTEGDLEVGAIWLMPIFPAYSYHGYDVLDYYGVNPDFGTLDEFKFFLDEAHKREIRVIIDMVLNHTSNQHPWFIEAQNPDSPYRDWYIWSETDPGMLGPSGQQVWHPGELGYYYGLFWGGMPDLNYDNPDVLAEMEGIFRFWLDEVGVDGFRLDGARYVVEEGELLADTEANLQLFERLNQLAKDINPDALMLGEVWTSNFTAATYVKRGSLDMVFDFELASAFMSSANSRRAESAMNQLKFSLQLYPTNQFAPFLTNHDMDRVMSQLGEDPAKARNAASLLLTAPGVPFVYYGEEIGMLGQKPDENIRTPMQWNDMEHAGFTTGIPWRPVNPDYPVKNVAIQTNDPDSLLGYYADLIQIRNQNNALLLGETYLVDSTAPEVYSILRVFESDRILVVVNLGNEALQDYNLTLEAGPLEGSYQVISVLGREEALPLEPNVQGGFDDYRPLDVLPANSCLILQLK